VSLFCRHNRFTADCPICSKGTVLEQPKRRQPGGSSGSRGRTQSKRADRGPAPAFRGPYASAGPYTDEEGVSYEVRLERVPGGLRLAEWAGGVLRRAAPRVAPGDLVALLESSAEREALDEAEVSRVLEALGDAPAPPAAPDAHGTSKGQAGELRDELRVERAGDMVRVGRYVHRPGPGWELRDAPVMMPAGRLVEALSAAARAGVLEASGSPSRARP
jgi:hypothetical protein